MTRTTKTIAKMLFNAMRTSGDLLRRPKGSQHAAAIGLGLLTILTGCVHRTSVDLLGSCLIEPRAPLGHRNGDPLRGFADFHTHMFSEVAFGGFLFAGKAFVPEHEPEAMEHALAPCQHTSCNHLITRAIVEGSGDGAHEPDGYPSFATWPSAGTHTHQQMYLDWVYRSYRYGLRLIVITATNSEALCRFSHHPLSCSDDDVVHRYVAQIRELEDWVRREEGGWLQVATSAAEARRIIGDNRLAVVMGAEVDTLFNCAPGGCSPADIETKLNEYEHLGIRQINPVHLVDSAFGGSALYDERLSANQFFLRGYYHEVRDCRPQGVTWQLRGAKAMPAEANALMFVHSARCYAPDRHRLAAVPAHCNARGLTPLGRGLIQSMMRRGMLIDLEHMSDWSVADTLALTGTSYPVMLSHTWFRDLKLGRDQLGTDPATVDALWNDQKAEMHRDRDTIEAVRASGGVVGVLTNQGYVNPAPGSSVANSCDTSVRSFAQALLYAVDLMGPAAGIGFGTDFNGFPGQPAARFGPASCGTASSGPSVRGHQTLPQTDPVRYDGSVRIDDRPLTLTCAGHRAFDFNTMGLAHYGLLPDMIADLWNIGVPTPAVQSLFRSAEAYVKMWERAETEAARR